MYIFLDFDGVIHPLGKDDFSLAQDFAQAIEPYDVKIVFSTAWREYLSLEQLKKFFPEKIHSKMIGMTPIIPESVTQQRFKEILMYNRIHNIKKHQWVALDDNSYLFPPNLKNLILIEEGKGLNKKHLCLLSNKIEQNIILEQNIRGLKKKNNIFF